jgi:hypothetical protein
MNRILTMTAALLVALSIASTSSLALAGIFGGGDCCCPDCGHKVCQPKQETIKEKKHCWDVECKDICIPKAKWPWESCCEPKCAKVKTIKVLKKVEYECEKCHTKWEVLSCGCQDGNCAK